MSKWTPMEDAYGAILTSNLISVFLFEVNRVLQGVPTLQ